MLHLQPGVHLQKVKALVPAHHKLHCAGTLVIDRTGQRHRLLAHGLAGGVADERAGRLLDHLLVAALDRALALVEVQQVAVAVANQLDLDMTRLLDKFFNEHPVVAKAVARLIAAAGETLQRLLVVGGHAQALAAAAGAGLDHHRVTDAAGDFNRALGRLDGAVDAGNAVDAGHQREFFGFDFVAHGRNRVVLWADEDNACLFGPARKIGVFAEETVARVHRLGAGLLASRNDLVGLQITLAAGRRADVHSLVSQHHMASAAVSVGIHRHRADAHFTGRLDDAAGDFAPVGDQDFGEHQAPLSFLIRLGFVIARACLSLGVCLSPLGPRRTRRRECPPPAARAPPLFPCDGYTVPQAAKGCPVKACNETA